MSKAQCWTALPACRWRPGQAFFWRVPSPASCCLGVDPYARERYDEAYETRDKTRLAHPSSFPSSPSTNLTARLPLHYGENIPHSLLFVPPTTTKRNVWQLTQVCFTRFTHWTRYSSSNVHLIMADYSDQNRHHPQILKLENRKI